MSRSVIRFLHAPAGAAASSGPPRWGVLFDRHIAPLDLPCTSTGELVRHGLAQTWAATPAQARIPLDDVRLLSPVTSDQQFLCQGVNYRSHVRESGMDPAAIPFNTFFTKSPHCITGPCDDVVRPAHVRLLDYEIELGLVMKADLRAPRQVTTEDLPELLAGITIVNDLSARDIQLPQTQFYKGKSYRGFGPVGPTLLLLEPQEWALLDQLRMELRVNGLPRQNDLCAHMIYKPHRTLTELSGLHDVLAGDLIATGTPAGCAAKAPGKLAMALARRLLSDTRKWALFIQRGLQNPLYLQPGDVMELSIRTDDGQLDLGRQRTRVVAA